MSLLSRDVEMSRNYLIFLYFPKKIIDHSKKMVSFYLIFGRIDFVFIIINLIIIRNGSFAAAKYESVRAPGEKNQKQCRQKKRECFPRNLICKCDALFLDQNTVFSCFKFFKQFGSVPEYWRLRLEFQPQIGRKETASEDGIQKLPQSMKYSK